MILNQEKHGLGYQDQKSMVFSLMLPGFGKSMFTPCCQKVSSIHEIKIRRTEFQYFLVENEKFIQISIIEI